MLRALGDQAIPKLHKFKASVPSYHMGRAGRAALLSWQLWCCFHLCSMDSNLLDLQACFSVRFQHTTVSYLRGSQKKASYICWNEHPWMHRGSTDVHVWFHGRILVLWHWSMGFEAEEFSIMVYSLGVLNFRRGAKSLSVKRALGHEIVRIGLHGPYMDESSKLKRSKRHLSKAHRPPFFREVHYREFAH